MRKHAILALAATLAVLSATPAMSADKGSDKASDKAARERPRPACLDDGRDGGALAVVGLTADMQLVCFREKRPGNARAIGTISGLMRGDVLVGIDYRVQDNGLYGVSRSGGVYRIDPGTAVATRVSSLTVALEGNSFGVDFNPAADRLRVVSDSGQNLRHNINTGGVTIVDDPLDYPPATPVNAVGPNASMVTGSAYTNNDLSATTATTLYALDTMLDQVALQSPPNDGTLAATGKLGTDAGPDTGFDIYSSIRNGTTVEVHALASMAGADGKSSLYGIDLPTGKATLRGMFPSQYRIIGIAIPLDQH